jgi:Family of unknown function (DUF5670)
MRGRVRSDVESTVTLLSSLGFIDREEVAMLWTIFVILLVLWLLGVVTSYTLGGFIHVLLVIAVIMAVMQLIQGRRAL